jgi:hypothetical protein
MKLSIQVQLGRQRLSLLNPLSQSGLGPSIVAKLKRLCVGETVNVVVVSSAIRGNHKPFDVIIFLIVPLFD